MKKHIVFDIDGTLLNTTEAILRSLQATLEDVTGKPYDRDSLGVYMGITGVDALSRIGVIDVPGTLALWAERLLQESWRISVYDGIPELLEDLAAAGYSLGMVTSKTGKELDADWDRIPCNSLFATTVCADDTQTHKPAADPLLKYMEKTGTAPEDLLYIGDSEHDLLCAQNAGVDFILAGWGALNKNLLADVVLQAPQELLTILDSM